MTEKDTKFSQSFFDQVETIKMKDGLAIALEAISEDKPIVYSYYDAVKLAGHSCLAISGAYRLTQIALKKLYGDEIAQRGEIEVTFKGAVDYKVNGPTSQVVTLITGAASDNGFHGFPDGKFKRDGLLTFDEKNLPPSHAICSTIFKRADTGTSIEITYTNSMLPSGVAIQDLVKMVLLENIDDMFVVTEK